MGKILHHPIVVNLTTDMQTHWSLTSIQNQSSFPVNKLAVTVRAKVQESVQKVEILRNDGKDFSIQSVCLLCLFIVTITIQFW